MTWGRLRGQGSAGAAERYDSDYLRKALPPDGSVILRNITNSRGCFVLAGPKSRDVLSKLTDAALDNAALPMVPLFQKGDVELRLQKTQRRARPRWPAADDEDFIPHNRSPAKLTRYHPYPKDRGRISAKPDRP